VEVLVAIGLLLLENPLVAEQVRKAKQVLQVVWHTPLQWVLVAQVLHHLIQMELAEARLQFLVQEYQ
jgi:hypothetical protein